MSDTDSMADSSNKAVSDTDSMADTSNKAMSDTDSMAEASNNSVTDSVSNEARGDNADSPHPVGADTVGGAGVVSNSSDRGSESL